MMQETQSASDVHVSQVVTSADNNANTASLAEDCADHCVYQFQCQCHGNILSISSVDSDALNSTVQDHFVLTSPFLISYFQTPPTPPPDV